jgi:hypothetical protein
MNVVPGPTTASVATPALAQIADAVWDEDIVAAHATADTSGLILSQLTKRSVTFNTAVVDGSVVGQLADDGTATYDRTTDSVQAIRDAIPAAAPSAATVAAAVWDRSMASHTTQGTFAWTAVRHTVKTIQFTGAANLGQVGNVPLFTITGNILVLRLVPRCTEDLAGATATLALGVTGETARFIAATTATDIDNGEFWFDASPAATGEALPAALVDQPIDNDIVGTVATADITDGTLEINVFWLPLSSNGALAAA